MEIFCEELESLYFFNEEPSRLKLQVKSRSCGSFRAILGT